MMVGLTVKQGSFINFLSGFSGMHDLVINIDDEGYSASGTVERSYFVKRWTAYCEDEGCVNAGSLPLGQLELFKSLISGCGSGGNPITITLENDILSITGAEASFSMPPVAEAHSQAGVESLTEMLLVAKEGKWDSFGESDITFALDFDAPTFQQLRNVGKAIQTGALYCVSVDETFTLEAVRDQIRVQKELEYGEFSTTGDESILWFGKWLMDALKAMPGKGTVHVYGSNDAPLIIRHEAPDDEAWGTLCVIAPRQESGDEA
jgi:hypothetical protein